MNKWLTITDILNWFPLEINSFAKSYGYEYKGVNYIKYGYLAFDGPEKHIELHTAKNASHLGYVIVTKKINRNSPLITNAHITVELDLPSSLTSEQFFPFVDQQLTNLLESIQP